MAYAVIANWIACPGEEPRVQDALSKLAVESRQERGCQAYHVCRDPEDASRFTIFELYDDEAAFNDHASSSHFATYALNEGIPLLMERSRTFLTTIEE